MRKFVWKIKDNKVIKVDKDPNGSFKEWTHCKKDLEKILELEGKIKRIKSNNKNLLKKKNNLIYQLRQKNRELEIEAQYWKNKSEKKTGK